MFIEAFGIEKALANRILTAWKGVAYYEYKYAENITRSMDIIRWLQSKDSEPYDLAMFGHLKEMYQMHKRSTIDQMKALPSSTVNIRSEEHTSELPSLMRSSYTVFCLTKKRTKIK